MEFDSIRYGNEERDSIVPFPAPSSEHRQHLKPLTAVEFRNSLGTGLLTRSLI